jgi:hypothetical protein
VSNYSPEFLRKLTVERSGNTRNIRCKSCGKVLDVHPLTSTISPGQLRLLIREGENCGKTDYHQPEPAKKVK